MAVGAATLDGLAAMGGQGRSGQTTVKPIRGNKMAFVRAVAFLAPPDSSDRDHGCPTTSAPAGPQTGRQSIQRRSDGLDATAAAASSPAWYRRGARRQSNK